MKEEVQLLTMNEPDLPRDQEQPQCAVLTLEQAHISIDPEGLASERVLKGMKIRIVKTDILTEGIDRKTIKHAYSDLNLRMVVFLDPSLFGQDYRYNANFRTIHMTDNCVRNNYFERTSNMTGKLDSDFAGGGYWLLSMSWQNAKDAVSGINGLYHFKPYFVANKGEYRDGVYHRTGRSEFSISDEERYFWIERSTAN